MSAKEVAAQIDSKVRTIENWAANGNIKQNDQGKYGLISALKHQLDSVQKKLEKTNEVKAELVQRLNENYSDTRERKAIAEADKEVAMAKIKELELGKLQGKLVDAEEVLNTWKNGVANVKAKMIGIPAKMALELSGLDKPEDIQARLTQVIDEALIELGNG